MPELYEPRTGDPVSASQQAELVRLARRTFTGPDITVTPDGVHFRRQSHTRPVTVVVVVKPVEGDKTLTVRMVAERDDPPDGAGQYVWVGDPFKAWPDFGRKAEAYVDFYLEDQDSLGIDTEFLQAYKTRSIWKVRFSKSAISPVSVVVVVVVKPTEEHKILIVRQVIEKDDPPESEGMYEWKGDSFEVWPDFGRRAIEYVDFYLEDQALLGIDAKFLHTYKTRGIRKVEFVEPTVSGSVTAKFRLKQSGGEFPDHLRCRTWNSETETEGDEDVFVAKPWELRRTSFHLVTRAGIRYVYTGNIFRTATRSSDSRTEKQVIIPIYHIGDIVTADKGIIEGIGVLWEGEFLEWEARIGNRAWTRRLVQ